MALWVVKGGRNGEKEELALQENVAIIGWDALPDLSHIRERQQLTELLATTYPDEGAKTRSNWESQIWPFLRGLEVGDLVVMPLKSRPSVMIGRSGEGGYRYRPTLPEGMRQTRSVHWQREVARDAIDQDLRFSFGAFMTVCRVRRNDAENRVGRMLTGGAELWSAVQQPDEHEASDDTAPLDLEGLARDQIRQLVARRFTGHQLTSLVAALLEIEGYTTRQAPEGPDGGIDILAGRGALGFDGPRLAVQVKSGNTPSDVRMIRELQGVVRRFGADHGLFVSWAGFRGTAEREVARDFFGTRLWTSDDVIRGIEEHYDRLPEVIRAELPLRRLWAVTSQD